MRSTRLQRILSGCGLLLFFSLNASAQISLGRLSARVSSPLPPFDVDHAYCFANAISSLHGVSTDTNGRLTITMPWASKLDSGSTGQFSFRLLVDGVVRDQRSTTGTASGPPLTYTYQLAPSAPVVSIVTVEVSARGGAGTYPSQTCTQSRSISFSPESASSPCVLEAAPAATLLLPYFQVDLSGQGVTTLFSVNNSAETAVLAHVTLWSDLAVPVLDFTVYLTGYDVQTINLSEIILKGKMPQTASAGQDLNDVISPQGKFSQDINFASCSGLLPPPVLPVDFVQQLKNALTGQFSNVLGGCAGIPHSDNIARGFVTVDTVNNCTLRFPGDPGYFGPGGTGDATNQNVLWGDYFYFDRRLNRAQGYAMVHIGADSKNPETSIAGQYTFYGHYANWTAADNREPLATNFAMRYMNDGPLGVSTKAVVWRDPKVNQNPFTCGTLPKWYPLGGEQIVAFDEEEQPVDMSSVQPAFGAATQLVSTDQLPLPSAFGWLFLNLNTPVGVTGNVPPEDPNAAQAWVGVVFEGKTEFSTGFEAIRLDSACKARHLRIGG